MDKKEAARLLYMDGWTIASIAATLRCSTRSIDMWIKEGDWKHKRTMSSLFEQTSIEAIKELADYQLRALIHHKDLLEKEGKFELLDKGHFDALSKAFANIKGPELKWEHVVRIMRRFLEHVQDTDLELAQRIESHSNTFINAMRRTFNQ